MTPPVYTKRKRVSKFSLIPLICISLMPLMLLFGDAMKRGASLGLDLSFRNIIPTLFPFFILSDLWGAYIQVKENSLVARVYKRLFGINAATLPAFILGTVCGFPLGVRGAVKLYEDKIIDKNELCRLSGFANNPSAAFVISGIGAGLYRDIRVGILLYLSVLFSAVAVGLLFRGKNNLSHNSPVISRQSFNIVDSVRSAGLSSITVASYIIFFSALIGILSAVIKNDVTVAVLSSLLEITNASSLCASLDVDFLLVKHIICAFALGFSGFSVHLQTFALFPKEISKIKYLTMKLAEGVICSAIMLFLTSI